MTTAPTVHTTTLAVALEARAATPDAPAMVAEGIAVPWDTVTDLVGYRERFARGAINPAAMTGLAVYWNHQRDSMPVGVVTAAEDRDAGLWTEVTFADTATGRDMHALLKSRAVKAFSVSFMADTPGSTVFEEDGTVTRVAVTPKELSFAGFPAYPQAAVEHVRAAAPDNNNPPTSTPKDAAMDTDQTTDLSATVAELRTANDELGRRLGMIESNPPAAAGAGLKFRSLGEFVKGLADRSVTPDDARTLEDAYRRAAEDRAFATIGDAPAAEAATRPGWIARDVKLVDKGRPLVNLFSREPLPADGMSVAYPKLSTVTDNTGKQATQGAALGYVELKVDTGNAPVDTYGNYASLSRQAIERSSVAYLNKVLTAQKIFYGKATNRVVRDLLVASTGTNTGADISTTNTTAKAWIDAAIDAAGQIDANSAGLNADVWIMSLAHFRTLATIVDGNGRPVFALNGDGANTIGGANLMRFTANVAGLPVIVDSTLTGVTSYVASAEAITTLESPGAPFSLTGESVINLTKDFALYGYLSATLNDAKGIVKVKTSAA